jgi:hypothetical protein
VGASTGKPIVELAPDGVAPVRIVYRDEIVHETDPTKLEWLDSAGRVVRVVNAPAAGRGAATSIGDLRAPMGG